MGKKLTLLVDDDSICNALSEMLLKKKFREYSEIAAFTSPVDGLAFFKQVLADESYNKVLVLLDINMPVMTGWEFLEDYAKLPESNVHVDIFILTSSVSDSDKDKARNNPNVKDFITKPITLSVVEKLFEHIS